MRVLEGHAADRRPAPPGASSPGSNDGGARARPAGHAAGVHEPRGGARPPAPAGDRWWTPHGNARPYRRRSPAYETTGEEDAMCRWMAWYGQPVLIEELLFKPRHGLIDQSLHARMGVETTNGDGFGLGWYGA